MNDAPPRRVPPKRRVPAWVLVVVLALVAALGLRLLVAEAFRIPTPSMEPTLLVGDYVLVSKLHYGARLPVTLGLPFTDRYLAGVTLPPVRLPGFADVERGDVVVFNLPTERGPLDRRTHFVKRIVGLPGDTVAIERKELRVNGRPLDLGAPVLQAWRVRMEEGEASTLRRLGVSGSVSREQNGWWRVRITEAEAAMLARAPEVAAVEPAFAARTELLFPYHQPQTLDAYGPVAVPRRGQTVRLTGETWPVVRDVIGRYEGRSARRYADGRFEIDGELTDRYTFRQDYYFVLGDNRDDSSDSRRWGFVPGDHLVGKAVAVYFSWDARADAPRWARVLHPVR